MRNGKTAHGSGSGRPPAQAFCQREGGTEREIERETDTILVAGAPVDVYRRLEQLLGLCGWKIRLVDDVRIHLGGAAALVLLDPSALREPMARAIRAIRLADPELPIVVLAKSAATHERAARRRAVWATVLTFQRSRHSNA